MITSSVELGVQPHWQAKGEPRKHPNETNEFESSGLLISQARGESNDRVFERDPNRLEKEKLHGCPLREILVENVVSGSVHESRDEKGCEEFEVCRECASWEVESSRKKV